VTPAAVAEVVVAACGGGSPRVSAILAALRDSNAIVLPIRTAEQVGFPTPA
jgi:hypothetical protein